MATQQPIFELIISGTGSVGTDTWIDLGVIPSGKQILYGFITYIAEDKALQFETRSNNSGQSTGTLATTQLHDWAACPSTEGVDRDLYHSGFINTLSVVSTGVEHWWIHIASKSASSGVYDYIIYYTTQ